MEQPVQAAPRLKFMRISTISPAVLLALCVTGIAAAQTPPPASDVAASLQARYDRIHDFSADFVHSYQGGLLKRNISERGVVQVKKPGKMRWEYQSPEKKLFVSDGRDMYLHEVAANQVTIFPVPAADQAATAALFLAGKGNLTRDFTVSYGEGGTASTYVLKLQPKNPERDYDWLQIVVDRSSLQIRSLSAADAQGGRSTFTFSNFKENPGLSDKTFTFKIPRGADVIRADAAAR
jgi:outer membrane lipoprotein carrier protein